MIQYLAKNENVEVSHYLDFLQSLLTQYLLGPTIIYRTLFCDLYDIKFHNHKYNSKIIILYISKFLRF